MPLEIAFLKATCKQGESHPQFCHHQLSTAKAESKSTEGDYVFSHEQKQEAAWVTIATASPATPMPFLQ